MAKLRLVSSDEVGRASLERDEDDARLRRLERGLVERSDIARAEIMDLRQLTERWEGLAVIAYYDRPTNSWVFIALHEATLGQAVGGCRMRTYPTPSDALRDAMRLAEAMTHKWAVIDSDFGGGKSVLAVPRPLEGAERLGLLERFGHLLEGLGGLYTTGEDLGTTPADMAKLAEVTRYVHGLDRNTGRAVEPGLYTAQGVSAGIRAALAHVYGDREALGCTILIEGVGHVGGPLARMLGAEGANLILSDIDEETARALAQELGCAFVSSNSVYATPCDVYAPCAVGGTLNGRTVAALSCRIVAGAANNQLESVRAADQLHERGILYAPDYVLNAGGAIALPLLHGGASEREARARVEGIAGTLDTIFQEAERRDESPLHAAQRKVARVLAAARARAKTQSGTQDFSVNTGL